MGNSKIVAELADTIKDMERDSYRRFGGRRYSTVSADRSNGNASAEVIGVREDGVAFGRFKRTGQNVDRHGLVRARLVGAEDTGDQAGTLSFDFAKAVPVKVQERVFRQDGLY